MHDYHGDVDMLRKKVDGAAKLYGRKVWITEIAITKYGDPPSRDMEDAYLTELLPYLDSSDNVFRYSWFSSRNAPNDQNGGSNLLDENGSSTLTSTGKIYRDTPDAAYTKAKTLRASPVTRKRGFAGFTGENFGCDDATLLGLDDSWSYSWAGNPTQHNKCSGQNVSAEFVPMVNGVPAIDSLNTDSYHSKWEEANAQFLLGYNEPDYGNGHNHPHMVSPADAAAAWPKVQKLAAAFDPPLTLVSPSVASTGESGATDAWDKNGRSTWMDEFLGNCSEVVKDCDPSLIKYIGMHDYHGDVDMLRKKVDGAAKLYGRKVWITEIAITKYGDPPSRDMEDAYLTELLPYLDSSDNVFRYSWFSSRNAPNDQNGGSNLLDEDGSSTLTSTGKIYKGTPDAYFMDAIIV